MTPDTGKRISFRRLNTSDFENMRLLDSEADIMKFTPSRIPQTPEQTKIRLQTFIENDKKHDPLGVWAVELTATREFVAWFMILKTDLEFPEVGFMVVKKHWKHGYASEALQVLIDFAFNKLKLPGLSARTTFHNVASIRTLEKAGFQFIKTMTVPEKVLGGQVELKVFNLISLKFSK